MKTIIACTDFSPTANNAVNYAAALANIAKARLVLFHYYDYPISATDLPTNFSVLADDAAAGFEATLQKIKNELALTHPIEIDCVVRSFDLPIDLETLVKDEQASLVIMGMEGKSAIVNAFLGSVASAAIRRGKLPLLIIPPESTFQPLKKILFSCDDQHLSNPEILEPLQTLALLFDGYIEVLTLFDLEKSPELAPKTKLSPVKSTLEKLLAGTRHGFSYENEDVIKNGILDEAARSNADMVAMIPHHHSIISNILNRSKTQQVAAGIHIPLLVLGERGN